jgi:small subunit ribosomal protein S6
MENKNTYETLFVVDLTKGEEAVKAIVDKFVNLISQNGEITATNEWGKRRLAYPIEGMTEGYYVLVDFNAPAAFTSELERVFNITEGIMRSIVVAKEA